MNLSQLILPAPFPILKHELISEEANTSIVARASWEYRVGAGHLLAVIHGQKKYNASLGELGCAINSATLGAAQSNGYIADAMGISGNSGCYQRLKDLIGNNAKGLISTHKKWCAVCYQESMSLSRDKDSARVADELYWSLNISSHCHRHLCTLSEKCGRCFSRQPYISSKYEPGFCHSCGYALAKFSPPIVDEEIDAVKARLAAMDIFLPEMMHRTDFSMERLAKNLRNLVRDDCLHTISELSRCVGVTESALRAWLIRADKITLDSLLKLVKALQLPRASDLFVEQEAFEASVSIQPNDEFNFNLRLTKPTAISGISEFIADILAGRHPPIKRAEIAKKFGVSVGMLENAYRTELATITKMLKAKMDDEANRLDARVKHAMYYAVRRCGAKMRPFDWQHILAEFDRSINLSQLSTQYLDKIRKDCIDQYVNSTRRDRERDIGGLISDDNPSLIQ